MKVIEKATLAHLDDLALLFDQYRVFYRQPSDLDSARAFLQQRLMHSESVCFMVKDQERYVGFVQLYPLYHYKKLQRQWLLSDLFVEPAYRGRGLSVALIDRSKELCVETQACGLLLETEKTNSIGNQLYPKCGFECDDEHNYYNWWIN